LNIDRLKDLIASHCKADAVLEDDPLFDTGLAMSSIAFTELVMQIEEETGVDIDLDLIDHRTVTVGRFFEICGGESP
jgi:acyl carrier protein